MPYFNWVRWLRSQRHSRLEPFRRKRARGPSVEVLEDRTLLAAGLAASLLPAPLVSNQSSLGAGLNPQVAIDPMNPQKIVVVASINGDALTAYYSIDAGQDWVN